MKTPPAAGRGTARGEPDRPDIGDTMSNRKPKVGDEVLHCGNVLVISEVREGRAGKVATLTQPDVIAQRDAARAEFAELRNIQAGCDMSDPAQAAEWERCRARIAELDGEVHAAAFKVGLRCDLLDWIAHRGMWGRRGQLLSDDQIARLTKLGNKPQPDGHIEALKLLDGVEG